MPFSAKTFDFLSENMIRDDKAWYAAHKEDYKNFVAAPFAEFVAKLTPIFSHIDPLITCTKPMSRLYRDARYSQGKSTFRDNVWCSFGRERDVVSGLPGFFFEISPREYQYGMGYFCASAESMQSIRSMILDGDPVFKRALSAYQKQSALQLWGDSFKRDRYPDQPPELSAWLNKKTLCFICEGHDRELLFSDALADRVAEDFIAVAPVYKFLLEAESRIIRARGTGE